MTRTTEKGDYKMMRAIKEFFARLGGAMNRMLDNSPMVTLLGLTVLGVLVAGVLAILIVEVPNVILTVMGVSVVWVVVLFISKFIEEMKR